MPSYTLKIKSYLEQLFSIDFFSMKPSDRITFKDQQNYSSSLGIFVTWIVIALSITTFINFGSDMIYRKNPKSMMSQKVTPDPEYLNLSSNGFFIAFGIQNLKNKSIHYIDESIYSPQMIQRTKIGSNITLETIPLTRCSLEMVPDRDGLKEYYSRNQINNLYCIDDKLLKESALQSTWDGPFYKNLLINISPCTNSSNITVCKTSDVIADYLNFANYAMYFTNLAIDPSNFEKPITSFGKQIYTPISFSTLTYIEMLFGHTEFISDDGLLFEDKNISNFANYLSNRQIITLNTNMIIQIDMKLDKIKTTYNRYYDKLQDVLANTGGIIQFLTIIANIFVLPVVKLRFKLSLANSIFSFKTSKRAKELQEEKKKKKTQKNTRTKSFFAFEAKKIHRNQPKQNNNLKKTNSEKIEDYFANDKSKKLEISYFRYYFSCLGNELTNMYNKLLNKGLVRIDNVLDISYIMNKLTEIDILKVLLFDKTQRNLFDFIPKPQIFLEEEEEQKVENLDILHKELQKSHGMKKTEKARLALQAFNKLSNKENKTILDEKLIEMIPKLHKIQSRQMINSIASEPISERLTRGLPIKKKDPPIIRNVNTLFQKRDLFFVES